MNKIKKHKRQLRRKSDIKDLFIGALIGLAIGICFILALFI